MLPGVMLSKTDIIAIAEDTEELIAQADEFLEAVRKYLESLPE